MQRNVHAVKQKWDNLIKFWILRSFMIGSTREGEIFKSISLRTRSQKRRKENNHFFSFNYKRKVKVRFHFSYSSSPDRWERSLAWSTNNGDEVRTRPSSLGTCLPTICSSSLSRFLTDSETSVPSSLSPLFFLKYPASRHLVGRTSWRWGLGL